jgi:hypothetical protein
VVASVSAITGKETDKRIQKRGLAASAFETTFAEDGS